MYFRSQHYQKRMKQKAKILFKKITSKEKGRGNHHKFAQQLPKKAKRSCSSSEEDRYQNSECGSTENATSRIRNIFNIGKNVTDTICGLVGGIRNIFHHIPDTE